METKPARLKALATSTADAKGPASLEFGFCGLDHSVPPEIFKAVFGSQASADVAFVAAFQLAYQGFPWQPTAAYKEGASWSERRYQGHVYPAWHEVDSMLRQVPDIRASFHLNETSACQYVSGLLTGSEDVQRLVDTLVTQYRAAHVQINLTADGVPSELFMGPRGGQAADAEKVRSSATIIRGLCAKYPSTVFLVPSAVMTRRDGVEIDTLGFIGLLLRPPTPPNLAVIFDASAGAGKEPESVPEIPQGYPRDVQQPVAFTGGLNPDNIAQWLTKYAMRARQHGCRLVCDVQSGIREGRQRGTPVDPQALQQLARAVSQWAQPS